MTSLRPFLSAACLLLAAVFPAPCVAYLYDCGPAQYAGAIVKLGSTTEWVSEPFSVQRNAYATQFGAALGRTYGPTGAGFTVELSRWADGHPVDTIETWTVVPTIVSLVYYYWQPVSPIPLSGVGNGAYYALTFKPNIEGFAGAVSYSNKGGCYYGQGWNSSIGWFNLQFPLCVRVDGYYVPEPGCLTALGCGLVFFLSLRRRR